MQLQLIASMVKISCRINLSHVDRCREVFILLYFFSLIRYLLNKQHSHNNEKKKRNKYDYSIIVICLKY